MGFWLTATSATARPFLHDLNIRVVLSHNGDAQITETRLMDIDNEGTECYIGLGNMGQSIVGNLRVKDETGREFTCVDDWDIDQSDSGRPASAASLRNATATNYAGAWVMWDTARTPPRTRLPVWYMTTLTPMPSATSSLTRLSGPNLPTFA